MHIAVDAHTDTRKEPSHTGHRRCRPLIAWRTEEARQDVVDTQPGSVREVLDQPDESLFCCFKWRSLTDKVEQERIFPSTTAQPSLETKLTLKLKLTLTTLLSIMSVSSRLLWRALISWTIFSLISSAAAGRPLSSCTREMAHSSVVSHSYKQNIILTRRVQLCNAFR